MLVAQTEWTILQQLVLALWLAALGGCIGSFLNVVIYRLPRGKSLVHPGSACPACGHAIRWYHNVPVVGWLMLRGRCYDCGTAISPRYPAVEAAVALAFLALGIAGPLSGGASLPPGVPDEMLWGVFAWQATLLCVLLSFALIEYDGGAAGEVRYPWSLFVLPMVAGLVALAVWPQLFPLPAADDLPRFTGGITSAALGAAAGVGLGLLALPAMRTGSMERQGRHYALLSAVLVGFSLGWQSVCILVAATTSLYLPVRFLSRRVPWSLLLCVTTVLWLLLWRLLLRQFPMLGSSASEYALPLLAGSGAITLLAAWATALLSKRPT